MVGETHSVRCVSGPESDPVRLDFALEAKRYAFESSVSVRDLARLISRIRNRMFGVLVTTSYLNQQAYEEFKSDGHPIVVIAARDIVDILKANGYSDADDVRRWLRREFPTDGDLAGEQTRHSRRSRLPVSQQTQDLRP